MLAAAGGGSRYQGEARQGRRALSSLGHALRGQSLLVDLCELPLRLCLVTRETNTLLISPRNIAMPEIS